MRAKFDEMHLSNYASQKHDTSFILNGKEWGVSKSDREKGGVWVRMGCGVDHKLNSWPNIYDDLEKG